jgi:hypothetical protein
MDTPDVQRYHAGRPLIAEVPLAGWRQAEMERGGDPDAAAAASRENPDGRGRVDRFLGWRSDRLVRCLRPYPM